MEVKNFLEAKSLFLVMHLGCIFVKIKVAFVAESDTTVSQNIQIYFATLELDIRFDATAKPKKNRQGNNGTKNLGHYGTWLL